MPLRMLVIAAICATAVPVGTCTLKDTAVGVYPPSIETLKVPVSAILNPVEGRIVTYSPPDNVRAGFAPRPTEVNAEKVIVASPVPLTLVKVPEAVEGSPEDPTVTNVVPATIVLLTVKSFPLLEYTAPAVALAELTVNVYWFAHV